MERLKKDLADKSERGDSEVEKESERKGDEDRVHRIKNMERARIKESLRGRIGVQRRESEK